MQLLEEHITENLVKVRITISKRQDVEEASEDWIQLLSSKCRHTTRISVINDIVFIPLWGPGESV